MCKMIIWNCVLSILLISLLKWVSARQVNALQDFEPPFYNGYSKSTTTKRPIAGICESLTVPDGCNITFQEQRNSGSKIAEYRPLPGYKIIGSNTTRTCVNGTWTGYPIQCRMLECGFPGAPASGNVSPHKYIYTLGEKISYYCNAGFDLDGFKSNTCSMNEEWLYGGEVPICRENIAFGKNTNQSSRPTVRRPGLAVDDNKDTCSQVDSNVRWWEVDFGKAYPVIRIDFIAQFSKKKMKYDLSFDMIDNDNEASKPTRCARINGTLTTENGDILERQVMCQKTGQVLRISDIRTGNFPFQLKLCDVKVYYSENLRCGEADSTPGCKPNRTLYPNIINYVAEPGYFIVNNSIARRCENGGWSGKSAVCKPQMYPIGDYTRSPSEKVTASVFPQPTSSTEGDTKKNTFIIGVAIGCTAASISTIFVITLVVCVMRKYYGKRNVEQANSYSGGGSYVHDSVCFRSNSHSHADSGSPTIMHGTYSDPWDSPTHHIYDYINMDHMPVVEPDKNGGQSSLSSGNTVGTVGHKPPSISERRPNVDKTGYLLPHDNVKKRSNEGNKPGAGDSVAEGLLDGSINLRSKDGMRSRPNPNDRYSPNPCLRNSLRPEDEQSEYGNCLSSVNEMEVEAYGFPENDDAYPV